MRRRKTQQHVDDETTNVFFLLGGAKETQHEGRTNRDADRHQRGSQEYSHSDEKEAAAKTTAGSSANAKEAASIGHRGRERRKVAESPRLEVPRVTVV